MWLSFQIALQFLTIIPVSYASASDQQLGRSLVFYPVIGLIIGLILSGLISVLPVSYSLLSAALLLTAWVLLTGGLHIDGLADSADAWLGGIGNKQRTLEIMKDPAAGPIAVVVLTLSLLIKLALVEIVISSGETSALIWSIILARTAMPLLFLTTDYVRPNGIGAVLKQCLPVKQVKWMLLITTVIALFCLGFTPLLLGLIVFLLHRYTMEHRLDGFTGDTAGAMVELLEISFLLFLILF
ncbi:MULTISPECIES: adenosylcobinamide-GDP ribazoletransferase [Methylophaga]|uniref:Adenosylcobinamide-GDP ribazoletransferase n=1 Tax=Methylophaga aminisulfidivorans MP TaxID=1026882 RepID=F5T022_9GAMM|nr:MULTISPECIES: adenosylcobinamide-GDP ribazoletransferase [Methylophaga]EGL54858.1 cobalamin-5-phosphate synthase [Methylophaga aminisulfidivorans MP]WVI84443.1 adenosylcobinamide-GDP ribazoletransferase [Methylophaga thalassica]